MEKLVKLWLDKHPSVTEYSIPNIDVLITEEDLVAWEMRKEERYDFANWIPIFTNCTGVSNSTYYYNLNKNSHEYGKILGLYCCYEDIECKIVSESLNEFLSNPKYESMIKRRNDYTNCLKVSLLSDTEL